MEATVLIPTHNHGETLRYSVASAQAQTLQDFEILIVGDGAPEITRDLASDLMRNDARIHFFNFPKGERHGELHRHSVLAGARGRCVCYLCDDDLWLPSHLEHLTGLLRRADLANTAQLLIDPSEEAVVTTFDLGHSLDRALLETNRSGIGLACGGHTLEAYRRLPHGWRTTPPGIHTDTHMWQQFLDRSWCRTMSSPRPTVLKFAATAWDAQPLASRLAVLDRWQRRITKPGGETEIAWRAFESGWGPSPHPSAAPRNARFRPDPDFQPYKLGDKIEFAHAGSSYLSWGWSNREPWGVWSDGEEARITLSLGDPPNSALFLELSFLVFGSPNHPSIDVALVVNGHHLSRWNLPDQGAPHFQSVEIPAAPFLDLRFLIPEAAPARQVTDTSDHRRLGIGLISLHIRQAS